MEQIGGSADMTAYLAPVPKYQFFDANGAPLVGGKLYTYAAGTTTPLATYTDYDGQTANTNPIILDARGEASVWLGGSSYFMELKTAANALIWSVDNVSAATAATLVFVPGGTGGASQTVQQRLAQSIFLTDYINPATYSPGVTVVNTAFTNAYAECAATGKDLYIPGSTTFYKITDEITVPAGVRTWGPGVTKQFTGEKNAFIASDNCTFDGLGIQGPSIQADPAAFTKCNGIYVSGADNVTVQNCRIWGWQSCGIQFRESYNAIVTGNFIYANYYSYPTGIGASSDIAFYSAVGGGRATIANNLCFSNNSQGIGVNIQGYETDIAITGNVCVTLTNSLSGLVDPADMNRRHGILSNYTAGGGRVSVTGNICVNTLVTGIYSAGADGIRALVITSNVCAYNGYTTTTDSTLCGGVSINGGARNTLIADNMIYNFQNTASPTPYVGGIMFNGASGSDNRPQIINNVVDTSTANGIVLKGYVNAAVVRGNRIYASALNDVQVIAIAGGTGGVIIKDNDITRTNASHESIYLETSVFTSAKRNSVCGNRLEGFDNTTSATTNTAIKIGGAVAYTVRDNEISTYRYGFYASTTVSGRQLSNYQIDFNNFYNLDTGILVAGSAATALVPVEGNVFDTVTIPIAEVSFACVVNAVRQGLTLILVGRTAGHANNGEIYIGAGPTCTYGTLAQGDWIRNTAAAAGGTPGWVCTTAGAPGASVIKAMPNLV